MPTTMDSQKKELSVWSLILFIAAVILMSVLLLGKPASAAVAGLSFDGPEYINRVTNQNDTTNPYIDATLGTWKKDANNLYVLNGKWDAFKLYYGPLSNPFQNFVGNVNIDHTGWDGLTWISGVYKYADGTLLGLVHRERYWSNSANDCFYLGLAKSTDNGLNWRYLGDVLSPNVNYKEPVSNGVNSAAGNVAGVPYLVIGSDLYIYYNEQTGTEKRMSVAKASLAAIKTAIDSNTTTPFYKYNAGTWTEAGMGGTGSNIIPGGTISNTGLDYFAGHNLRDFHSDAAYVPGLGKYLITVNDEGGSRLLMYSSTDGINWGEETVIDAAQSGTNFRPAYSTFMSLSTGTSDDNSTVGNDFYIFYPRDFYPTGGGQRYFRIRFSVGNGSDAITVNDDHSSMSYDSNWFYSNDRDLGDYNNDGHFSNVIGAVAQYTFTGTGIDYLSEKNWDMGNVDVYIDNVFKQNVNLNNASRLLKQVVYSISGLSNGSHTIKIVNKTNSYGNIDSFKVYKGLQKLNNDASGITYGGSWLTSSGRGLGDYSDDVKYTTTNSDYFEYTFTGKGVDVISEKEAAQGNIDIYVDGVFKETISTYNVSRLAQQVVYSISWPTSGTHTIKGVKTSGTYMLLDALKVFN
ncbi:hypothetical protein [Cohnella lupini]|uniref:Uncharacterized protein n=1 Tax=Cohnella lupini TaxID=1294267 RepID=A0A3D9IJC6_9BACL|nr:hypothetical protein [Cohnella lupini]RED61828.1 hypothetical protein DFP95_105257 [Cohnella lupini]